jgi:glycerophosphoryl diester phosphodiesterase
VISLERRDGRPLRIGHRGAAALAPENTLGGFRVAIAAGVDLVEFDVVPRSDGALLVAHGLGDVGPDTPSLDDALRFFAEEALDIGAHLDLKMSGREQDVVAALRRHGLEERSFVSAGYLRTARAVQSLSAAVRTGLTLPRPFLGLSDDGRGAIVARSGLTALRRMAPRFVAPLLARTRATALVLHHSVVTPATVRAAHDRGVPVVAWTVDDVAELDRVDGAGVDAVVTNDPRIFVSTLAP